MSRLTRRSRGKYRFAMTLGLLVLSPMLPACDTIYNQLIYTLADSFSGPNGPLGFDPGVIHPTPSAFVNWETPHVHPLDLTPDGTMLLAVNTPDAGLEILDVTGATPVAVGRVGVGLDPVSVRARTSDEAWVVNHVSDSVSIVDLTTRHVVRTLNPGDERRTWASRRARRLWSVRN